MNLSAEDEMVTPKRFLMILGITALVTFSLIFSLNYIVNPYLEYETDLGLAWLEYTNARERTLKLFLYDRYPEKPEVVILGNSRSRNLPVDLIEERTGMTAFNAAVLNGSIYDYLAIMRYFLSQPDNNLQVVILNLDLFTFKVSPDEELYYYPIVGYADELEVTQFEANIGRFRRSISFEATFDSLDLLKMNYFDPNPRRKYTAANGVSIHRGEFRGLDAHPGPDEEIFWHVFEMYQRSYTDDDPMPAEIQAYFEEWLVLATQAGVCVNIVVLPLQPQMVKELQAGSDYDPIMASMFNYLEDLQEEYNFQLFDYSSAGQFGIDDFWFVDGAHFLSPVADQIIQQILDAGLCGEG